MKPDRIFDYQEAFSRTLGWVTPLELQLLRQRRIAIAGVGGVGGVHLLTLTRLGVGAFNIADMDVFELANFNRQAGAMISTLDKPKVEVMAAMARNINPELDIRVFPEGIGPNSYEDFLRDVDLYVDGLDFFAFDVRAGIFAACNRLGIPAVTVAPLGMGAALMNFLPGKMSFEDYFGFAAASERQKLVRFLVGLAPRAPHRHYLVDPLRADPAKQRAPSTPMACQLCAGVAATEALKILLGRGKVYAAPHALTYDAYLNKAVRTWRPGGYRNPLNRLLAALASRFVDQLPTASTQLSESGPEDTLERILELARWAQSGDNEQPWRFERLSEMGLVVRFHGHKENDVYDYDGRPKLVSLGCLVESLRLAASRFGWGMRWRYAAAAAAAPGGRLEVEFEETPGLAEDRLCDLLQLRSVDRRTYRLRALTNRQKQTLEDSLGPEFSLAWCESTAQRWRLARLGSLASHIRLSIPETAPVHQRIVDWDNAYSTDRIPALALGSSALSRRIMRWALADIRRAVFLGKLPGGTLASQLEMDLLPGLFSAGYFLLLRRGEPVPEERDAATIRAGCAVQRFWLTATRLGLALQANIGTLCFANYGRRNIEFSTARHALPQARRLAERFDRFCAEHDAAAEDVVFMGRLGTPRQVPLASRSIRRPLADLMVN